MKIARSHLRRLIKEEIRRVLEVQVGVDDDPTTLDADDLRATAQELEIPTTSSAAKDSLIQTLTQWLQGWGLVDRRAASGRFRPEYDLHRPFSKLSPPDQDEVIEALRGIEAKGSSDWAKNNTIAAFEKLKSSGTVIRPPLA